MCVYYNSCRFPLVEDEDEDEGFFLVLFLFRLVESEDEDEDEGFLLVLFRFRLVEAEVWDFFFLGAEDTNMSKKRII